MKHYALGFVLITLFSSMAQATCQLSLSRPEVKYGAIRDKDFTGQHKRWKTLSEREVQLNAICDMPVKMAIFSQGGLKDDGFRFASDSVMLVGASNATLDGKSVMLGKTKMHGSFVLSNKASDKKLLRDNEGIMPVSGNDILEGQQFSVTLTIRPALSTRDMDVTDKTTLESNLHFNVETE